MASTAKDKLKPTIWISDWYDNDVEFPIHFAATRWQRNCAWVDLATTRSTTLISWQCSFLQKLFRAFGNTFQVQQHMCWVRLCFGFFLIQVLPLILFQSRPRSREKRGIAGNLNWYCWRSESNCKGTTFSEWKPRCCLHWWDSNNKNWKPPWSSWEREQRTNWQGKHFLQGQSMQRLNQRLL